MSVCTCIRVPRMSIDDPHARAQKNTAPRGRPKGSRQSNAARLKIAEARQAQEREKKAERAAMLPATFPTLSDEMRRAITARDDRLCRSCGEDGPKLMVHTFLTGRDDLGSIERDPEAHAVMCDFCRKVANDLDARDVATMLRSRW